VNQEQQNLGGKGTLSFKRYNNLQRKREIVVIDSPILGSPAKEAED